MELGALKQQFLEYLEIERGRSVKTIENYDHYLERFLAYSHATLPFHITEVMVREYRLWLNRQPIRPKGTKGAHDSTLKKKTQNYYLIALRAFLKFMRKRGIESLSPETIELAKVGDRSLDLITHDELNRLLQAPKGNTIASLRDKAIIELLFSTGLRVSELCSIGRDLDLSSNSFSIRGKGDKVRIVFLSESAKKTLSEYLTARDDIDDAMFIQIPKGKNRTASKNQRLTARSIERIIKKHAIQCGITRKVTPHVIRHSFATDLLENGADLRSVQALLGHANIATTQIYTHVTDKHLEEIHLRFHGKRTTNKQ